MVAGSACLKGKLFDTPLSDPICFTGKRLFFYKYDVVGSPLCRLLDRG